MTDVRRIAESSDLSAICAQMQLDLWGKYNEMSRDWIQGVLGGASVLTETGVFDTIRLQHPVLASASAGLFCGGYL